MSSFGHERAQPDTGIQIAREIQIKNRASIDPAAGRLELIDNLHGSDLGRTRKRSCWKAGHQRVKAIYLAAEVPAQARHHMHHMRVALDEHQPVDLYRTVLAHAAEIVATKIHEHDVLGALLGIS